MASLSPLIISSHQNSKLIYNKTTKFPGIFQQIKAVGQFDNKKMAKGKNKKNYTMYNETLFEVENVIQIKWVKNRQYCYIKWKGYDERFNTWEPKEHITFCYDYLTPQEKDDDPQYKDNVAFKTPLKHHYQTRAKIRPPKENYKQLPQTTKDKQDHTEEFNSLNGQIPKIATKQPSEKNVDEIQVVSKTVEKETSWITQKEEFLKKILQFSHQEGSSKRIGKVQLQNGATAFMYEDKLKAHYPQKVIDFYERQFKSRLQKNL